MTGSTYRELLNVAMEAAWSAGRLTLSYFNTGIAVEWKSKHSPVTVADRESEGLLRQIIGRAFPNHSILGEEEGETPGSAPYRWIIDPLDGTQTFIRGVPLYGVLVGVEFHGEPIIGVIYLPALDEMIAAARGEGCTWNGRSCHVSKVERLDRALVVVTDERTTRARSKAYMHLAEETQLQRTWADCYGYALVATGRAEVAIDPVMSIWDCAALLPILEEAGGCFTSWCGQRTISGGNAVATNALLHSQVLKLLAEEE